jgi:hypothetical protein
MGRGELEYRSLDVAGARRGYWLARGSNTAGPPLMVLPGSGISGKDVATTFSGLATRGPAAGVTAVFPDGWHEVWHIVRPPPGEPGILLDMVTAGSLFCLRRVYQVTSRFPLG